MKSEEHFLKLLDTYFPRDHEFLKLGRGDDCAVLAGGKDYCVSSDIFLEDVHFRRSYFSAADIGYKALAVNISDIAGMGAKPVAFTMDLMAPSELDDNFWNDFLKSMSMLARQNDIVLAGGDLSRADKLGISISIFGVAGGSGNFIRRNNCAPEDIIFTVGDLGLARAGLMTLEALGDKGREAFPAAVNAHLRPKPKVMIGTLLNAAGINSLMDVSDGLARDLPRLIGPNLGADIRLVGEQLNGNVLAFAMGVGTDPIEVAMLGGEDYALLGTTSPDNLDKVKSIPGLTVIGKVTDSPDLLVNGEPFKVQGFDHFDH
ncbi:thiamine-phosphate kinase [Pseudodesulfovibrio sp. zrk46]|uniref:thiamine-phosphate kinase n=1 Tax=Pseudodesulfovibrio sp. zrk46 TaxID=2725288 RepID=UPI0014494437|nr:thiamine-phosphate kinase [Pseudodesulfovibrio sp. zrk46]QJB57840.1 thiamine-phosphate kinase [Pseudodesulfovibrio sp. zrk46]